MSTKKRLVRLLVYDGTEEWIESTKKHNYVKEEYRCHNGVINEYIINDLGDFDLMRDTLALDEAEN